MKILHAEHRETWLKVKKKLRKYIESILCSLTERYNLGKMSVLSKAIYRLNAITKKFLMAFFQKLKNIILKCIFNLKEFKNIETILKKNNIWELTCHDFKTYYKVEVT